MATVEEYVKNLHADEKSLINRINALADTLSQLSETVQGIADDSEANAQAIVELAEIIGG